MQNLTRQCIVQRFFANSQGAILSRHRERSYGDLHFYFNSQERQTAMSP